MAKRGAGPIGHCVTCSQRGFPHYIPYEESARHLSSRRPRGLGVFSWGRLQVDEREGRGVTYRLFRRSITGKLRLEARTFRGQVSRADIARTVWNMRIHLREIVDAHDLALLGVEEPA